MRYQKITIFKKTRSKFDHSSRQYFFLIKDTVQSENEGIVSLTKAFFDLFYSFGYGHYREANIVTVKVTQVGHVTCVTYGTFNVQICWCPYVLLLNLFLPSSAQAPVPTGLCWYYNRNLQPPSGRPSGIVLTNHRTALL